MDGNIDAIYQNVCQSVRWILWPFCKYLVVALPVAKGVLNMISALSPHSWLKPLQKEGEVFNESCEWLEFSLRTTVLFTSLLNEFEDLLEQIELETHPEDGSNDSSAAIITQCKKNFHLLSTRPKDLTSPTEFDRVVCQNATKALLPKCTTSHMRTSYKPTSTTARQTFSTVAEKAGVTAPCGRQNHVYQRGALKRWRRILLVVRAVRVLRSFIKPKEERSNCPARPRLASYTPAIPLRLPFPPSCIQSQAHLGVTETKSAPIMIFSEGPQIHLISQELRAKLESHVRRKRTHRAFGFPPKLSKLLGDSAASVLNFQGAGDDKQSHRSFSKPKSHVNPIKNAVDAVCCNDNGFLNVIDIKNTLEQVEETKGL